LENVAFDSETRRLDLDDSVLTENTRAAYPNAHIANALRSGRGGHPKNIIMLMNDAFGVLPPIAKLTHEQAVYHFLSGFSTDIGDQSGPEVTFSACFGAPLMALQPTVYANMLGERIKRHDVNCWLVNTGWTGGKVGTGKRLEISITRTLMNAAIEGKMDTVDMEMEPVFNIQIPKSCEGVPSEILNPRNAWQDQARYDETLRMLAERFNENFKTFESEVSNEVIQAGPKTGV
jgi:phosphoenolpyruvate carboxykinase (ATP)